jgi:hypothetical protein
MLLSFAAVRNDELRGRGHSVVFENVRVSAAVGSVFGRRRVQLDGERHRYCFIVGPRNPRAIGYAKWKLRICLLIYDPRPVLTYL